MGGWSDSHVTFTRRRVGGAVSGTQRSRKEKQCHLQVAARRLGQPALAEGDEADGLKRQTAHTLTLTIARRTYRGDLAVLGGDLEQRALVALWRNESDVVGARGQQLTL